VKPLASQPGQPGKVDIRISKMGYEFDVYNDFWELDNSKKINWRLVKKLNLDKDLEEGFRRELAVFASEHSAYYTVNTFDWFKRIFVVTEDSKLKVSTIQNYLSEVGADEYKLGSVKAFVLDCYDKGYPGISSDVAKFLESLHLKGNEKGKAVSKGCPHSGAYTMQEQQSILEWAVNAFTDDELSLEEYAWLILSMYTGARPVQLRALAREDLLFDKAISGENQYQLRIPVAKQRSTKFREEFKQIEIDEDLALLLFNQFEKTKAEIKKQVNKDLPKELEKNIPVFPSQQAIKSIRSYEEAKATLLGQNRPDVLFMTSSGARNLMNAVSKKCMARTERLEGEFIKLTSRRFRYTLGTNAFRRGLGAYHIAEILGHKDIQNVKVYTENTHEVVDLIDEAMAPVLAPLAQAFAGTLIESERDAIRANDPRSRIKAGDGSGVGNCGEFGFCASGGRQCYLCTKFQPWVHGQHEKVLQSVLDERETLRKRGASEFVVQSTDRLVMAVTQVVQLCQEAKEEESVLEVSDE